MEKQEKLPQLPKDILLKIVHYAHRLEYVDRLNRRERIKLKCDRNSDWFSFFDKHGNAYRTSDFYKFALVTFFRHMEFSLRLCHRRYPRYDGYMAGIALQRMNHFAFF